MPTASGTKLGSYEVVRPMGPGGMGESYQSRDTRLGRDVAIKVRPETCAAPSRRYAVSKHDRRFLINSTMEQNALSLITVTTNWSAARVK